MNPADIADLRREGGWTGRMWRYTWSIICGSPRNLREQAFTPADFAERFFLIGEEEKITSVGKINVEQAM